MRVLRIVGFHSLSIVLIWLLLIGCAPGQPTDIPTPSTTLETTSCVIRYSNPAMGFAVEYPCSWEVITSEQCAGDPQGRLCEMAHFVSDLYAGGEQVFGRYSIYVVVCQAVAGKTITDTVEYGLTPLAPTMRAKLEWRYLTVGSEPAIELTSFPWERFGSRQIWVVHNEWEYRLTFRPAMDLNTPSDIKAGKAFDAFLHTFTFVPITQTPACLLPTITPVPTPTPTTTMGK